MKDLVRLANHLDSLGLHAEASVLDSILRKVSFEEPLDKSMLHGMLKKYLEGLLSAKEVDVEKEKKKVKDIQGALEHVKEPTARTQEIAKLFEKLKKEKPELIP